jgi:hypothetical protein
LYTFDAATCDNEGWTGFDRTAQTGTYFHVDDFIGLGTGSFGRLVPIDGARSLWCGMRPDPLDHVVCHYVAPPGYGNNWDQIFESVTFARPAGSDVLVKYDMTWDMEIGVDELTLSYLDPSSNWQIAATHTGVGGPALQEATILDSQLPAGTVTLRFRFVSDGFMSDEDGARDSDGACVIPDV